MLYPDIEGSTDRRSLFFLALTFGLMDDPPGAVERAVGLVEDVGRRNGVEHPIQMTVATSDGSSIWAFRYSSAGRSRSLFYSTDVVALRQQHPEVPVLRTLSDEARLVVSEPLGDLEGAWNEVPEASWGVVKAGQDRTAPVSTRSAGIAAHGLIGPSDTTCLVPFSCRSTPRMLTGHAMLVRNTGGVASHEVTGAPVAVCCAVEIGAVVVRLLEVIGRGR